MIVFQLAVRLQKLLWLRTIPKFAARRVALDPRILVGKPVVKGTRIAVEMVVDLLAAGWTQQQILDSYPTLTEEGIRAGLAYAGELLHGERAYSLELA